MGRSLPARMRRAPRYDSARLGSKRPVTLPGTPADHLPDAAASDAELLQALRREGGGSRALVWLRRMTDGFLPERLRDESLEARRRARFVVITTLIELPFLGVLVQQLVSNGMHKQATVALCFGLVVLVC